MKRIESYSALITSAIVILALFWTVGKPHAENFIDETVDARISIIEQQLNVLEDKLIEQKTANDIIKKDTSMIKRQSEETQQGIQKLLDVLTPR